MVSSHLAQAQSFDTFYFDSFQEISLGVDVESVKNTIEESNTDHSSSLIDSFKYDTGLFNLNQASGSLNNQSNTAVISFTPGKSLSDIQLEYFGKNTDNIAKYSGTSNRESLIENSFGNSRGIFMVNQSPGNLNQQSNLFILSLGSSMALSDFELAAKTGSNEIEYAPETEIERKDILKNSFSGSLCIAIISQSSGDLNTIKNTLGISFSRETIR